MPPEVCSHSLLQHRLFEEVLSVAHQQKAQFVALPETGVTLNQLPGLSHRLRFQGWNISAVPANALKGGGRGGVAILSREPYTTTVLHQAVHEAGQLLSVQVFGMKESWVIHCGYRRPSMDDSDLLLELSASISVTRHRPWFLRVTGTTTLLIAISKPPCKTWMVVLSLLASINAAPVLLTLFGPVEV